VRRKDNIRRTREGREIGVEVIVIWNHQKRSVGDD
jgi:hypothetical protein